jgi:2-polyprenyl-3-methyl-5-hydroxy-6-metoxy-1,4-benzoquinol methylase
MKRQVINDKTDYSIGERMSMDGKDKVLEESCFARYTFASQFTEGKSVVDAACADGYGAKFLKSSEYVGLDYDDATLAKARAENSEYSFKKWDLEKKAIPECDVLVTFETIEHLEDPIGFLKKASKKAKEIILSVPNNENPGQNPHHKWIFNLNEFKDILTANGFNYEVWFQENSIISKNCYPGWIIVRIT